MSKRQPTIQRKLMTVIMVTSTLVLLLTCAVFVTFEVISFRKQMVRTLTTRAQIIAANSTAALAFENEADAKEVLSSLKNDPHAASACLYDKDGRIFATYPENASANSFPVAPEKQGFRFEGSHFVFFQPVFQGTQWLGTLYLKSDLEAMYEQFRLSAMVVVAVLVTSILLAFALSISLQKRISNPILSLADTAKRVSEQKDYSVRAPKMSEDEIGALTEAFNEMLSQIQRRDESFRQLNAELEQRVRERTAQLETSNKEMEAFSYSVSHDLRAPLRGIDGFSKALLDDYSDKLDDTGKGYLNRVRVAATRMATLIDDLLQLSKMSRAEMRRGKVDMSALAGNVANDLKQTHPERNVTFIIAEKLSAEGDAQLLGVVFDNLLRNAWKFTSKHPTAKIEVGSVNIKGENAFFVRDDGAGFDMSHADILFNPFQRLHRQSDFEGTGIGLATVQRIIQRHKGRLWAEGAVEKGAAFYFTLWEGKRNG